MKLSAKEITYQECWDELLSNNNNNHDKASAVMIEIITNGACAVWDGEKIDRIKEEIISKFSKERKTDETTN